MFAAVTSKLDKAELERKFTENMTNWDFCVIFMCVAKFCADRVTLAKPIEG
jgi:hypothetical protein